MSKLLVQQYLARSLFGVKLLASHTFIFHIFLFDSGLAADTDLNTFLKLWNIIYAVLLPEKCSDIVELIVRMLIVDKEGKSAGKSAEPRIFSSCCPYEAG